ncbi:MAG: SMC-Scp complex subunit ScpB [Dethiobacteria bacterium]
MDRKKTMAIIEGLLFINEEPLTLERIAEIVEYPPEELSFLLQEMQQRMKKEEQRGLQIIEVAGGYLMGTKPEYASYMDKLYEKETSTSLSRAALETLAIIAYKQPITRVEIEAIRGVRVDKILENLLKRQLIKVVGRKEGLGRPLLYGVTEGFLKYFGLNSLDDLPPLELEENL